MFSVYFITKETMEVGLGLEESVEQPKEVEDLAGSLFALEAMEVSFKNPNRATKV